MFNFSQFLQWDTEPPKNTEVITPKIINVGGSSGSGKTLIATLLGHELSKIKYNVLVIYAQTHPSPLGYLCDQLEDRKFKSLGQILVSPRLSQKSIESNLVFLKNNNFLAFLGFQKTENHLSYPKITSNQVHKFFQACLGIVDFVIVDGVSHFPLDALSAYGYQNYHFHLEICEPSMKSYYFHKTTEEVLGQEWVSRENKIYIINKLRDVEGEIELHNFFDGIVRELPYCEKLERQFLQGKLLHDLHDKKYLKLKTTLHKLIQEVLLR